MVYSPYLSRRRYGVKSSGRHQTKEYPAKGLTDEDVNKFLEQLVRSSSKTLIVDWEFGDDFFTVTMENLPFDLPENIKEFIS